MECDRAIVLWSGMIDSAVGPIVRSRVHRHVARGGGGYVGNVWPLCHEFHHGALASVA